MLDGPGKRYNKEKVNVFDLFGKGWYKEKRLDFVRLGKLVQGKGLKYLVCLKEKNYARKKLKYFVWEKLVSEEESTWLVYNRLVKRKKIYTLSMNTR